MQTLRSLLAASLATTSLALAGCGSDSTSHAADTTGNPGLNQTGDPSISDPRPDDTSMPPWPAPTDVAARVASAGLDLGPMGMAEHYHPRLSIQVGGQAVPIPANIGVDPTTGAMSALHTHEADGTIHVEADTSGEVFTLGQFFAEWGVKLASDQIGGVRIDDGRTLSVTSDGESVSGDPNKLRLEPEQQIVVSVP